MLAIIYARIHWYVLLSFTLFARHYLLRTDVKICKVVHLEFSHCEVKSFVTYRVPKKQFTINKTFSQVFDTYLIAMAVDNMRNILAPH